MRKMLNLTEGSILKKLLLVALPILLTTISQMAYNLTDMFWIGRVDNIGMNETAAVSAVGISAYFIWFTFGIILIAKIGTSVKVSHSVGENKPHKISVYASNGLLLQLVFGIFFSVLILVFARQFLGIFNISEQLIINYAMMYIPIVGGFIFFQFLSNGFISINEGLGQTKSNLIILAIGFMINMILDPLFILIFKFGVRGAAISTVIAQGITFVIFFILYKKQNPELKVFHTKNFNLEAMKNIIEIGLPVGIQSVFFTIISIYIARRVLFFGENVMSAQRIGVQVEQLTWMITGGFQTAITVFVGQNFGAKLYSRIRRGIVYISMLLIPYGIGIGLLIFYKGEAIMRLFLNDPVSIQYGITYLKIVSISQVFMVLEGIGVGVFNGLGKTAIPSINGIIGNGMRIPLVLWLSASLMENGIWWAFNISSVAKGLVMLTAVLIVYSRLEKLKFRKRIFVQKV